MTGRETMDTKSRILGISVRRGAKGLMGLLSAWLVCAVAFPGCSVFEPREPDRPKDTDTGKTPFVNANDASGVFANLTSGIQNLDGGNYVRSLGTVFNFIPLLYDEDFWPGEYDDWSKEIEQEVVNFILSGADTAEVEFRPTRIDDGTDFVRFSAEYSLRLVSKENQSITVYKGIGEFDIRRIGGIWQLERWEDVGRVGNFTTWGNLRGQARATLGG